MCLAMTPSKARASHPANRSRPDAGSLDEMAEASFTIEEGHDAKVMSVEVHEIKCPKGEVVLDGLMRLAMQ